MVQCPALHRVMCKTAGQCVEFAVYLRSSIIIDGKMHGVLHVILANLCLVGGTLFMRPLNIYRIFK